MTYDFLVCFHIFLLYALIPSISLITLIVLIVLIALCLYQHNSQLGIKGGRATERRGEKGHTQQSERVFFCNFL